VALNASKNAAILAASILSTSDGQIAIRVQEMKDRMREEVLEKARRVTGKA